jgi:hypothetical protein
MHVFCTAPREILFDSCALKMFIIIIIIIIITATGAAVAQTCVLRNPNAVATPL